LDQEHLLNCLHQVGIDSATIRNTVDKLLSKIASGESPDKEQLAISLERISFTNRKILSVYQFATKANFKMDSQSIRADLVQFVDQYLTNVAKDFMAGLTISIEGSNAGPFEIKMKPIEISMLIDNVLSNAKKAGAKQVKVEINRIAPNSLEMVFIDNGKGFSPEIRKIDDIFRKGFTTTNGSGLGLYHVSQILQGINGSIRAAPANGKGVAFTITVKK
jgi:signal transduction histidine kinase